MTRVSQIPTICHPSCLFENPLPWPIYCLRWMRWGDASFSDQDTYHLVNSNLDHVIVIKLFRERTWAHPFTPSPFHSLENLHTYHRLKSIPHWSEHVYHMGKWHECKIESSWLKNSLYLKRSHKYETVRHDAMLSKSINCTNCVASLWTSWWNQGWSPLHIRWHRKVHIRAWRWRQDRHSRRWFGCGKRRWREEQVAAVGRNADLFNLESLCYVNPAAQWLVFGPRIEVTLDQRVEWEYQACMVHAEGRIGSYVHDGWINILIVMDRETNFCCLRRYL